MDPVYDVGEVSDIKIKKVMFTPGGFGLVSHKEQVVFRVIQAVFQIIDNAAARAHA